MKKMRFFPFFLACLMAVSLLSGCQEGNKAAAGTSSADASSSAVSSVEPGLYLDGEEGFMHIAEDMQHFWGISDATLDLFLQLKKQKEDSFCRKYITKIADKELFNKTKQIIFQEQNEG